MASTVVVVVEMTELIEKVSIENANLGLKRNRPKTKLMTIDSKYTTNSTTNIQVIETI